MTTSGKNTEGKPVLGGEEEDSTTVRLSIAELVDKAIQAFASKLEVKTVAEFIRLVEFQKELGQDEPKEIRASWIEPSKTSTDQ
jgi:hypothetical protein